MAEARLIRQPVRCLVKLQTLRLVTIATAPTGVWHVPLTHLSTGCIK